MRENSETKKANFSDTQHTLHFQFTNESIAMLSLYRYIIFFLHIFRFKNKCRAVIQTVRIGANMPIEFREKNYEESAE